MSEFEDLIFDTEWFPQSEAKTGVYKILKIFYEIGPPDMPYEERTRKFRLKFQQNLKNGGTRIVLPIHQYVLKISLLESAPENKEEVRVAKCLGDMAPKLIDYDKENYHWIIFERLNDNPYLVKQKARELFPNLQAKNGLFDTTSMISITALRPKQKYNYTYDRLMHAASSEGKVWLEKFFEGLKKCNFRTADLQYFNWGVSTFTGNLIPLDFG